MTEEAPGLVYIRHSCLVATDLQEAQTRSPSPEPVFLPRELDLSRGPLRRGPADELDFESRDLEALVRSPCPLAAQWSSSLRFGFLCICLGMAACLGCKGMRTVRSARTGLAGDASRLPLSLTARMKM